MTDIKNESNLNEKHDDQGKDVNTINSLKTEEDALVARYENRPDSPVEKVKFQGLDGHSIISDDDKDRVKFQGLDRDSIYSEDERESPLPPVPDGGWGWVVVLAAFLVSACADGLAFSFGLLHEEFTNYFKTTQSETSLIGSLFIATPLLSGPIMSALVDRYGCRIMTMIAGVVSCMGFLLASRSNSVGVLCLTFGFLSGLAMGILYVTAVVSVAFWFDKRRNLAVSLASCGIGVGTVIYAPLTEYLLSIYDWRNTVVILAGTLLNMCVCGALMRTPDWLKIKQKRERQASRSRRSSSAGSISSRSIGGESLYLDGEELKTLLQSGKSPEFILATLASSIAQAKELEETTQMNAEATSKRMHSAIHLPTFVQQNEKVPPEVIEKLMENKTLYNIILQNYPDIITRRKSEVNLSVDQSQDKPEPAQLQVEIKAKKPRTESENKDKVDKQIDEKNVLNGKTSDVNKSNTNVDKNKKKPHAHVSKAPPQQTNWLRQMSTDHHYLKDMPLYSNTIMRRGAMMSITRYKLKSSSLPNMYRNSTWSLGSESDDDLTWYDRIWHSLKASFDIKMFTEFHFLMFNLSSLILSVWFIVPYFFLKSYMTAAGVEGGEKMISIIGVASSIGIVVLGWAGDQPWVHVTKTYACCLIICGLSVAAYPLCITNFWVLAIVSTVFGLSFASSYSYTPAILMELMPIDHFTVAYGLILLSQGIGHLIGPPIGGMLYDLTGHWDLTFYMGGIWLIISGICVGVIPYTKDVRLCGTAPLLKEAEEAESAHEV